MKDRFSTSLRLNNNGKWSYRIKYYDEFGVRREIERVIGSKTDTYKALSDMITHMSSGGITDDITIDNLFCRFLDDKIKQGLKRTTINDYKSLYKNYISPCAHIKVNALKPSNVKACFLRPSGATMRQKVYDLFKLLLKYAYQLGYIDNISCIDRLPRPQRHKTNINNISSDELIFILDFLKRKKLDDFRSWLLYNFIFLCAELGTRRGELCGLCWDNINLVDCYIDIKYNLLYDCGKTYIDTPKTDNAVRRLFISYNAVLIFKDIQRINNINRLKYGEYWRADCYGGYDLIFRWQDGTPVHPDWFTSKFKLLQIELGFEHFYRIHDLRHYNAAVMVANGVDFKTIQDRLGHADINTTLKIYAYSLDHQQQKAVDVLSSALIGGKTGGK